MAGKVYANMPTPATPRRILIIRPSALGDVARTVPALPTLRRAFPDAQIDWLVQDTFADAIRHHPDLNAPVPFPRKRFGRVRKNPLLAAEISRWVTSHLKNQYDWVIDLQGLLRSGLLTWATKAPARIGFANAKEYAWLAYNRRHNIDPSMHTVDRMLALLAAENLEPDHDMQLYAGLDDHAWLDDWLEQHNLTNQPYACIAPTARWLCKCWPIDRFANIANRLIQSNAVAPRIVVLASPTERPLVQPLLDQLPDNAALLPQTTVGQMMAILSRTRILICNDSAPLHIAVGFDRPIVSIFGPTDPALVGPYRRDDCVIEPPNSTNTTNARRTGYRHRRDDQSLIAQVTTDTVWTKTLDQLTP